MNPASAIMSIDLDELFTYELDNGFARIYRDGNIILNGVFPHSKMVIAAVAEIEELRERREQLNAQLHDFSIFIEPRTQVRPQQVFVEDRKYEILISRDLSALKISRYGDIEDVPNFEFFYALATALHNARLDVAQLTSELIEAGYADRVLKNHLD